MSLVTNVHGELYNPDDFEPRMMKLRPVNIGQILADEMFLAKSATRVGDIVECPECGTRFEKKTNLHRYCCGRCRERAGAKRRKAVKA